MGLTPGDIHRAIIAACDAAAPFAVATVLDAAGSTPAKAGSRMIIFADGTIRGTIGGGRVEAKAIETARAAIAQRSTVIFEYALAGETAAGMDPICGGTMRVLVDADARRHRDVHLAAAEALDRRQRGAILMTLRSGAPVAPAPSPAHQSLAVAVSAEWVASPPMSRPRPSRGTGGPPVSSGLQPDRSLPDGRGSEALPYGRGSDEQHTPEPCAATTAALSDAISAALTKEQAAAVTLDPSSEVLIEPILPRPLLLIAGGGHVAQAVAAAAAPLGFEVLVIDDRPEFAAPSLFPPGAATRCAPIGPSLAATPMDGDTFVVIVTRGHAQDAQSLSACINNRAAYLGMIGSRRKVAMMREHFLANGLATAEQFDAVHAPIGLDIGALTVPEIAVSIVAELIAVRRGAVSRKAGNP